MRNNIGAGNDVSKNTSQGANLSTPAIASSLLESLPVD
jgi:hypothetical protein